MKYAILGHGTEATQIQRVLREQPDAEIVYASEPSRTADREPTKPFFVCDDIEKWESLLSGSLADAVIFSEDPTVELAGDQLRKLVQVGLPVLAIHPACDLLLAFELQMIQRDTGGVLVPYWPGNRHPLLETIEAWCCHDVESPIGQIEQLVIQRIPASSRRGDVLYAFSRDAEILVRLTGGIDQVGALHSGDNHELLSNLSVHMSCAGGLLARWCTLPRAESSKSGLLVVGQKGQATLELHAKPEKWLLSLTFGADESDQQDNRVKEIDRWNDVENILNVLQCAIGRTNDGVDWNHACRALELTDTVEQSLRRDKTIHLYGVEHTEEATFKTMMAAGGCLVLLATLGILLLMVGLDSLGLTAWGMSIWKKWPIVLLLALLVFLAIQLLRFIFPDKATSRQKP